MSKDRSSPHFSFLSILRVITKNWMWTISFWGVTTVLVCAIVYKLPPIYKAETLILVESQKIPEKLVSSTVNAELQDRLATISQEVLSATRLQTLIEKFNLYRAERAARVQEEIIDTMRKDVSIKLERGWTRNQPGAFRVTYQGRSPEVVAAVVNQIGTFFIDENLKTREEQAAGTSEFIGTQLEQAKKSLEEQERKLSEYKLQHKGELPQQENSLLAALASLHVQLQGNQDAIARAQQNKVILDNTVSSAEASLSFLKTASRDPGTVVRTPDGKVLTVQGREKESDVLRSKLEALRLRYTDSHPEVKMAQRALARALRDEELDREKEKETAAVPPPAGEKPPVKRDGPEITPDVLREQERIATLKSQAAMAQKELELRQSERQQILSDIGSYQSRVEKLPVREQEMAGLVRDYQISKNNYEQLLNKSFSAEMATDMEKRQKAERFTVLDPARVPERPFKPNRPLFYTVGIVMGLLFGVAAAFGRELNRNVVLGEWELPANVVILGRVPKIDFTPDDLARSPFSEVTQTGG